MTYPAKKAWSQLAEELKVKGSNAWVQLMANEEVVNCIA